MPANQPLSNHEIRSPRAQGSMAYWIALTGMMLVAASARLVMLSSQSLSSDEVLDIEIARLPLGEILRTGDSFPPLHHLLLRLGFELGMGDLAGRYLSVIYGLGAVIAVNRIGHLLAGPRCGVIAGGLFAIWPAAVYFSQEGRAYSLFLLVGSLTIWLFFRALLLNRPADWVAFAIVSAIGGLTHYYMAFVQAAVAIVWLLHSREPKVLRHGFMAFLLLAVLQIPVLWLASFDLGYRETFRLRVEFGLPAIAYTGWTFVTGYCLGPSLRELHSISAHQAISAILGWAVLLSVALVTFAISLLKHANRSTRDLAIILFTPFILAVIATLVLGVAYNVRYVVACIVPLVVLIAIAIDCQRRSVASSIAVGILLAATLTSLFNRHLDPRYHYEDTKSAIAYMKSQGDRSPVFTMSTYMRFPVNHYVAGDRQVFPISNIDSGGANLDQILAEEFGPAKDSQHFWLFYSREFHGDPDGLLLDTLLASDTISLVGQWPGVRLYRGDWSKRATR